MEEKIMEYLHPSVSSKIIDNSVGFVSAQGVTQLFCAFTSDQGPDNRIQMITSPTEFLFHYGSPNMRKHGQAAYNMLNWLNSHGGVFALRVAPENSGYSHAIVNVQTKVEPDGKVVKDASGQLVAVDDVKVRTTVAYTSSSNISEAALEADLNKAGREKTVDGFENNWLLAVYPKGRGKAYDNLGFRLTLTDAFDETYSFRVYNFEVTATATNGSVSVIDGPFQVALDPEAVSSSNESMFIKYVVEKYSLFVNVLFNEEAYDRLGEIINPDVNPNVLDFFTGVTREVGGQPESFFHDATGKDQDVHVRLQRFDENGEATGAVNLVDVDSSVEAAIVDIDDSNRSAAYAARLTTVSNMKVALSKVQTSGFGTEIDKYAAIDSATGNLTGGFLYESTNDMATKASALTTAQTSDAKETAAKALATSERQVLADLHNTLDFARAIETTPDSLEALVGIFAAESKLGGLDSTVAAGAGKKASVVSAEAALTVAKTAGNAEKLTAVENALVVADEVLDFAKSVQNEGTEADTAITTATASYSSAVVALQNASNPNLLPTDVDTAVNNAVTSVEVALNDIENALKLAVLEVQVKTVTEVRSDVDAAVDAVTVAVESAEDVVETASGTPALKTALVSTINGNIAVAGQEANEAVALTYNLKLQDFNSPISFANGSDGDLDESNPAKKAQTTKDLLIKAYKGLVDPALTSKKEYPIDLVLDANYPNEVKNAIVSLTTEIRDDFMGIVDTGFQANPQQALDFRKNVMQVSSYMVAIFTQDFVVYDEYTGKDIKVTSPYYLASKIPSVDESFGLHFPFVGPRRGTISGFKKMSFNPTEPWKEQLYKKQINYVEADPKRVKFGSQLTSQTIVSALSNINNVRALLRIKRDVEELAEDYQFEFNDAQTLGAFQYNLNGYLQKWISNRACTSIKGTVYASAYDQQQKVARVKIELVFNSVIERILIDLVVNR
jgi:hypothetical protein